MNKTYEEYIKEEIREILKEAKKENGMSLEALGDKCGYGKSQVGKFLSGKAELPPEIAGKLIDLLDVGTETSSLALLEKMEQMMFQEQNPGATKEDMERELEWPYCEEAIYDQWEKEQERQLKEMEQWFMKMDVRGGYLLDVHYKDYKEGQIPNDAIGFIQNYMGLNQEERELIYDCMRRLAVPMDNLDWMLRITRRYHGLAYLRVHDIDKQLERELTHKGTMGDCRSTKAVDEFKVRHWESFRSQIKDSSYAVGTYFYRNMRLLAGMDSDIWKALIMFLLLGDGGEEMTGWQDFFLRIRP